MKEITVENLGPYIEFLIRSGTPVATAIVVAARIKGDRLKDCGVFGTHTVLGDESRDGIITEEKLEAAKSSALKNLAVKLEKIQSFLAEFNAAK